jgi:hypothetical protein
MGSFRVDWHGSFAVIVTPFTEDGDVDEGAYIERWWTWSSTPAVTA